MAERVGGHLELLDYRRRVHHLYARVRELSASDAAAAHRLWRTERDALFRDHPQSAFDDDERRAFTGLRYFPYDPRFRFTAAVRTDVEAERFEVNTSDGATMALKRFGAVELPVGRLALYWIDVYGGGVFLSFRDRTSGTETYGGGRYLLDTVKGADLGSTAPGALILDFNFAYHPSCHYDDVWSCPLAPRENWLSERIEAGERSYAAGGHS
ncbi:MAG: DUF1684 domain-containing protein [Candidatus Limnocylindria bacterium]